MKTLRKTLTVDLWTDDDKLYPDMEVQAEYTLDRGTLDIRVISISDPDSPLFDWAALDRSEQDDLLEAASWAALRLAPVALRRAANL
jgi:hypothetical protein